MLSAIAMKTSRCDISFSSSYSGFAASSQKTLHIQSRVETSIQHLKQKGSVTVKIKTNNRASMTMLIITKDDYQDIHEDYSGSQDQEGNQV